MDKDNQFWHTQGRVWFCVGWIVWLGSGPVLSLRAQTMDSASVEADRPHLTLLFAGDIMGHDSQIRNAYDSSLREYQYRPTFSLISDYVQAADIAVANLEVTLAGPPFKGYPQFSSPNELALATRDAGFDVLVTANNHALDRGAQGMLRTLDRLDSMAILHAGTYRDSAERATRHPLIIEKNGIRVALLNYTYGTNGLTVRDPLVVNRIERNRMEEELQQAQAAQSDYIIVCIHWGKEYERLENSEQEQLALFLIEQGADAIIGSHPHVVQPVRFLQLPGDSLTHYPVVYSLGNFVSNQRDPYTDGGIIAELHLSKEGEQTVLDSLQYLPHWVWRDDYRIPGRSVFQILPVAKYETTPDSFKMTPDNRVRLERFIRDTREHLDAIPESSFYRPHAGTASAQEKP